MVIQALEEKSHHGRLYDIKTSEVDGKAVCLFGIFDGHGGSRAAEFLKGHLFQNLLKHPSFSTNTKLAISETYQNRYGILDSEKIPSEMMVPLLRQQF